MKAVTPLQLDPSVDVPRYQAAVDIHCMPGSYHGEERPGDVSAGANYDCGIFATTGGALGALNDGGGQAVAAWIKKERADWRPARILDIGATVGHNAVPIAQAFPDAASHRYRHGGTVAALRPCPGAGAWRERTSSSNRLNAEEMAEFADESFDWVQTTMFLHELSNKALPQIIGEGARVLRNRAG